MPNACTILGVPRRIPKHSQGKAMQRPPPTICLAAGKYVNDIPLR
jgi:hypothetical protein